MPIVAVQHDQKRGQNQRDHGDADKVVPVEASRQAYKRLKEISASVEYKEYPGCSHGSWNPAFCEPNFMKWLFSNTRRDH